MRRRRAMWAAAVAVVLGAVMTVLIDRLDGGWPWVVAAAVSVAAAAGFAAWAAGSGAVVSGSGGGGVRLGPGAVSARRAGSISTKVRGAEKLRQTGPGAADVDVAAGAVHTDKVKKSIETDVER